MGERTSYAPGTFSWAELATSDADAAKAFYTSVFGWEYRDNPIPDGQVYSMALRDGKDVAALFGSDQPPHWNCYVTVESADATAARAGGARRDRRGRAVRRDGRRADGGDRRPGRRGAVPVGAEERTSARRWSTRPGAMTWNDLITPDPDAVGAASTASCSAGRPRRCRGRERLPRDPQRRARERRHDAARPDAWARRRRTGCRTSATRTSTRLVDRGRGPGRAGVQRADADAAGHDRGARRSAGRGVRGLDRATTTTDGARAARDLEAPPGERDPEPPALPGAALPRRRAWATRGRCSPRTAGAARGSTASSTSTTSTRPRTRCWR